MRLECTAAECLRVILGASSSYIMDSECKNKTATWHSKVAVT